MTNEQLKNLEDFVANIPDKLAPYSYYTNMNGGCYCVVGAMLKNLGVQDTKLRQLGDYVDDWVVNYENSLIWNDDYDYEDEYHSEVDHPYEKDLAEKLIETFGLTAEEIRKLQDLNDQSYATFEDRAVAVKSNLENIIKEYKGEI